MTNRRHQLSVLFLLVGWCVIELWLRRTGTITDDWHGWRQADTQAIARHLAFDDFDLLRPRIDWGGDGAGYVESELPLYAAAIAVAIRIAGESVWAGQLLSVACVGAALLLLHRELVVRFGAMPAAAALLAALSVRGVVVAGTSIQPDTMALLAFVVAFLAFMHWVETPRRGTLVLWVLATTLAGLVKPTSLQLGLVQGVYVLLHRRQRLADRALWLGWAAVVATVGAQLLFARSLYLTHGNTFGVLSGGDSKLPTIAALLQPWRWRQLVTHAVVWGAGISAVFAALYLAWKKQLGAAEWALGAGWAATSVLAFRYTSHDFGTHYHLPGCILGAWLVAHALAHVEPAPRWVHAGIGAIVVVAAASVTSTLRMLAARTPEPETKLGRLLATAAPPGTLVVVRARAAAYSAEWHTPNNYQDPRVFYLSRTHGWVLASDDAGMQALADYTRRGAQFYADLAAVPQAPALSAWLAQHAQVAARNEAGTIYALASRVK